MARAFNPACFFGQDAFSDITVKFGSQTQRCHKMILCTRSEYFMKLCGPDSPFAESNQDTIELHEDDESAVGAMLRWLYTFSHEPVDATGTSDFHLNVLLVADKYGLPELQAEALESLAAVSKRLSEGEAWSFISAILLSDVCFPEGVRTVAMDVCSRHLPSLLKDLRFRDVLRDRRDLLDLVLDRLAFAADLEEVDVQRCFHCKSLNLIPKENTYATARCCDFQGSYKRIQHSALWAKRSALYGSESGITVTAKSDCEQP